MEYIISRLSEDLAKKILSNKDNAIEYLQEINKQLKLKELEKIDKSISTEDVWKLVVKHWNYEISKNILRKLFKKSEKYQRGKESADAIGRLLDEWKKLSLGEIEWPCSQGDFNGFVQRINSLSENGLIKDEKVKIAAVKYRRLKEINTVRNDYLETLIFDKNENIVPTLDNRRGVDFFINGVSFDQKVAKSPTKQFIKDFGETWKEIAKNNPIKVAEYQYQDEGRFGADPRLYIVYLDENIPVLELKNKIDQIDISKPLEVSFQYKHKVLGLKQYKTNCFVILLSKNEK
ncbi:MAG: hypothetical protein AB1349_02615 [Elusimicrobiota bacterium]